MRILHLRSSEFFGGPERAIIGQCQSLQGLELICGSFVKNGKQNDFLSKCHEMGIETLAISDSFPGDLRVVKALRDFLIESEIQLVITHDYKANVYGYLAVRRCKTKQIAYFRGRTNQNLRDRIYNVIDNFILKLIPIIIVVSEKAREQLPRSRAFTKAVRVVPNAFDLDKIARSNDPLLATEERTLNIVVAGRLSYEKGLDLLMQAVAIIKPTAPPFLVHVYGHGPEAERLKEQVSRLKISECVQFCGFADDMLEVFGRMDFMVLPSRSEGMPNVILEAWSRGLGVVSTAVGGVPEMISSGENGLLVKPEDPQDLADKLLIALNNPHELAVFGKRGLDRLKTDYSLEKQAVLLNKIYREIGSND